MKYWVYVLRLASGAHYVGYTGDLERRLARHKAGTGAQATKGDPPVEVVEVTPCESQRQAKRRETQTYRRYKTLGPCWGAGDTRRGAGRDSANLVSFKLRRYIPLRDRDRPRSTRQGTPHEYRSPNRG